MIDLHAHVVLEGVLGAAGPDGPELDEGDVATGRLPCFRVGDYRLVGVRYRGSPFMDVDSRLAALDAAGISLQVLSPNPLTYFSHLASGPAVEFCRRHNDEMANLVTVAPDRLAGLAQLPMQAPSEAADELRRAVEHCGLLGAYVGTDYGRPLDDPAFDVVWATAVSLDVPVFLHPAPDGIGRPRRDERLARFDADLTLGFAYEETLAVMTVLFGGVLDRHPGLDLCVSHGGGATAWLADRLCHAGRTRPWAPSWAAEPGEVEARLSRLWWDAHVGGEGSLTALCQAFGTDHLVAGTNLAGWDQCTDPAYGDSSLVAVFEANARRLLRLDK